MPFIKKFINGHELLVEMFNTHLNFQKNIIVNNFTFIYKIVVK